MKIPTPYQIEALDYKSNILLSANAGSGKTFVLSKRFIEILVNEDVDVENIVAITFTDKAAGELNKKIANEIKDRIVTDQQNTKKLERVRRQLVSANISTIHSFCVDILRGFAPEAQIDANFIPIDANTSDDLIELSVEETINSLLTNQENSDSIKYLIRVLGSKSNVAAHLQNSIGQRKIIEQHLQTLYEQDEQVIAKTFNEFVEKYYEDLFAELISKNIRNIQVINDEVLKTQPNNDIATEVAALLKKLKSAANYSSRSKILQKINGLIMTAGSNSNLRIKNYLSKNRSEFENEIIEIEEFFYELISLFEADFSEKAAIELAHFGKSFISVFDNVKELYSVKKKQNGYLDYEDLLLFTLEIIELDEVKKYLSEKFKYIMIDEYQDTNELQYKIFMPILDHLKLGNLFVVGDEKQSIYMFRDAELEVFNKTKDDISKSIQSGKVLNLPHSYRMAPELVLFINRLFGILFEKPNSIYNEVEYNELICAADENEKGVVEFIISENERENPEAENIANKIIELVENGSVQLNEIGILCRKRNYFAELENHFSKKNIPFVVVGGKGFYQRQSIYDIYNYLSFLINRENDTALIGILRSPFFTVSDKELFLISLEEGKSFYEKVKRYYRQKKSSGIIELLEKHIKTALSSEIFTLLRTILVDTGYWAVVASKKNSAQEIANLEKLISIAREFSNKSFKNLYDFTVYLHNSIDMSEDEGQAQVTEEKNAVNLLTIHKAKGLEYKCVFLYRCNDSVRDDSVKAKSVSIDKYFGVLTKVFLDKNYFAKPTMPAIVSLYNFVNQKKNSAEFKRLLYVAVTRAMKYLFISAAVKPKKQSRDSFIHLFSEGLNTDFSTNNIDLYGSIKLMKETNGKYNFFEKSLSVQIPVSKNIQRKDSLVYEKIKEPKRKKFLIDRIEDTAKKEIISATKFSMFGQCPTKYHLTYELGFTSIYDLIKKDQNSYEFNNLEDEESKSYAAIKGKVIHSILKDELTEYKLDDAVNKLVNSEDIFQTSESQKLKQKIIAELLVYYKSEMFTKLRSYDNYKNEFEVYCEEGEHYLYGIIDKLIYKDDKMIIIDYKTDNIRSDELLNRAEVYFPQLKFYAYVLSILYPQQKEFEISLLFIKHSQKLISKKIMREDLLEFKSELNDAITKIHNKTFIKRLDHCSQCHFALEGNKCVKN